LEKKGVSEKCIPEKRKPEKKFTLKYCTGKEILVLQKLCFYHGLFVKKGPDQGMAILLLRLLLFLLQSWTNQRKA
jgi:hypothetical protein